MRCSIAKLYKTCQQTTNYTVPALSLRVSVCLIVSVSVCVCEVSHSHLSICLSLCAFVLSFFLSLFLSFFLSFFLYLFIYLFIYFSVSVHLPVCLFVGKSALQPVREFSCPTRRIIDFDQILVALVFKRDTTAYPGMISQSLLE